MTIPGWADASLSEQMPGLRAQEEGQRLEFKEEFPEQADRLAKEIAAFATSGGGIILLGVRDNGEVVGLSATDESDRDEIIERAQGIIRIVKPMVRAECRFAIDEGRPILVIEVGEQCEPVFYLDYRPYIRDGRSSRRAEPDEVKEEVWRHHSADFRREEERIELEQKKTLAGMSADFAKRQADASREDDRIVAEMRSNFVKANAESIRRFSGPT